MIAKVEEDGLLAAALLVGPILGASGAESYALGWMFWFTRNVLSGSYLALIWASRS
jgi:hypothetical protein